MIEKALRYIADLAQVKLLKVGDHEYATQSLHRIDDPMPTGLETRSLTSIVDYIKGKIDDVNIATENLIIHIVSPTEVNLYSELRPDMKRECYLSAHAQLPSIQFGKFHDSESFNIMMQSCFVDNEDKGIILQIVGNVRDEKVATVGDDGTSQSVAVKVGCATVANVLIPNPAKLRPYRTFPEVDQPESSFIFRMQEGAKAGLFEADGGAWRNEAMKRIKEYFERQFTPIRFDAVNGSSGEDCEVEINPYNYIKIIS